MTISEIDFELFDQAMNLSLGATFGPGWRTRCHQSAKIAARALRLLLPSMPAEMRRVELAGYMDYGKGETERRMVHVGWINDPAPLRPGQIRGHFAVIIGDAVYDPTFSQLGMLTTPIELPAPYFYAKGVLTAPRGFEGFHWGVDTVPSGRIWVGYKLQPAPLDQASLRGLMTDCAAKPHARRVAGAYRNLLDMKR